MKKHIFRIGDTVKIINPEIFVRCGYPLSKDMVAEELAPSLTPVITEMLASLGVSCSRTEYAVEDILGRYAYHVLKARGFGGRERTIHTESAPDFKGYTGTVTGKKVYCTGTYQTGGGRDEYGCYEPNYMDNQRQHIILDISFASIFDTCRIEACHVELVTKEAK